MQFFFSLSQQDQCQLRQFCDSALTVFTLPKTEEEEENYWKRDPEGETSPCLLGFWGFYSFYEHCYYNKMNGIYRIVGVRQESWALGAGGHGFQLCLVGQIA